MGMGDAKQTVWQEITQGIGKFLLYIVLVSIGVVVSVAMEIQEIVVSRKRVIIRVILSICAGASASLFCIANHWEKPSALIVPCVTVIGQAFFKWLLANWSKFVEAFINIFIRKNDKN
jgi:hypothetical protein